MKKDIPVIKVEDIAIAVAPRTEDFENDFLWDVYLINLKDEPIKNVLINSTGYGFRNDEKVKTSTFRYFFDEIGPLQTVVIEAIQTELFDITHEYWISFTMSDNYLFDKKYTFVSGSISKDHFTRIPFLDVQGVMIK